MPIPEVVVADALELGPEPLEDGAGRRQVDESWPTSRRRWAIGIAWSCSTPSWPGARRPSQPVDRVQEGRQVGSRAGDRPSRPGPRRGRAGRGAAGAVASSRQRGVEGRRWPQASFQPHEMTSYHAVLHWCSPAHAAPPALSISPSPSRSRRSGALQLVRRWPRRAGGQERAVDVEDVEVPAPARAACRRRASTYSSSRLVRPQLGRRRRRTPAPRAASAPGESRQQSSGVDSRVPACASRVAERRQVVERRRAVHGGAVVGEGRRVGRGRAAPSSRGARPCADRRGALAQSSARAGAPTT